MRTSTITALLLMLLCSNVCSSQTCTEPTIAHPRSICLEVIVDREVAEPFVGDDLSVYQEQVAKAIVQLMDESASLRVPWHFTVTNAVPTTTPRLTVHVSPQKHGIKVVNWLMDVTLHFTPEGSTRQKRELFRTRELLSAGAIATGDYPSPSTKQQFLAQEFVRNYLVPMAIEGTQASFDIRPKLCEHIPVTEGILFPQQEMFAQRGMLDERQSVILLSHTCFTDFGEERFIWKCVVNPVIGVGIATSHSVGTGIARLCRLNGMEKECLVVTHNEPLVRQNLQGSGTVYLAPTRGNDNADGFLR